MPLSDALHLATSQPVSGNLCTVEFRQREMSDGTKREDESTPGENKFGGIVPQMLRPYLKGFSRSVGVKNESI